jgi:hypothetical protein
VILLPRFFSILLLAITLLSLSACGGGDTQTADDSSSSQAIRVNAGANIILNENQSAEVEGGSSGGEGAITYEWQSDASIVITHNDTSLTNATLLAPSVTQLTVYSLTLIATDTAGSQQSDTITVSVSPVNISPVAIVEVNQIAGYANNEFPLNAQIVLNGSNSSDADPQTNDAAIIDYNWQQIAGPNLLAGIDSNSSSISLVAPTLNENQQAQFRLTVTDQEQATTSIDYTIILLSQQNTIPEISVNEVRSVFSGELVVLSAEATSNAPGAEPFTASWTQNSTAQINDTSAFSTAAISPMVLSDTIVVYQITASDSFRNTVSAQVEGVVYAPVTRVLNDTGVTSFADSSQLSEVYQNDFPGQDASFGADRQTASGQVIKVGEGEEGFDFTRLDNNGDAVENPDFTFSCVRDNVSGLVWQVKDGLNTSDISYTEQTFSWYSEEDNGNFEGSINAGATSCNIDSQNCNTQAYADELNNQGLCGFYDWRLPNTSELQSIIHYGQTTPPLVDNTFFPNLGNSDDGPLWYWTNQSSADGVRDDIARNAWAYDMTSGTDGFIDKTLPQRVILVRAGR